MRQSLKKTSERKVSKIFKFVLARTVIYKSVVQARKQITNLYLRLYIKISS